MTHNHRNLALVGLLLLLGSVDAFCQDSTSRAVAGQQQTARPEKWAQPLTKPGLPNLHKVSDQLYRGAQPTAAGVKELKKMGIKTIISFRAFHSDRDIIGDTEMGYVRVPINTWEFNRTHVVRFLEVVTDKTKQPVFVHCQHGSDRTGTMCAIYRIVVQGWTKDDAIEEMTKGGFGYHKIWKNLIKFVRALNVEALKIEVSKATEKKQ